MCSVECYGGSILAGVGVIVQMYNMHVQDVTHQMHKLRLSSVMGDMTPGTRLRVCAYVTRVANNIDKLSGDTVDRSAMRYTWWKLQIVNTHAL